MQVVWSPEEDQALLDGLDTHGKQWKKIVSGIPGRNVNQARNRYLRLQEGRSRIGKNRCQYCRQTRNGHICMVKMLGGTTIDIANPIIVGEAPAPAAPPVQPNLAPHDSSLPLDWLEPYPDGTQASRALDDALQSLAQPGLQPSRLIENEEGGSSVPDGTCLPALDGCAPLATDGFGGGSRLDVVAEPYQALQAPAALIPPAIERLNTNQLNKLLVDLCWPTDEQDDVFSTAAALEGAPQFATAPPLVLANSFEQPPSPIEA